MRQLHDVLVEVSMPRAPAPGLEAGLMQNPRSRGDRRLVRSVQVIDSKADLRPCRALTIALVQREVQERSAGARDGGVTAADPAIVRAVVAPLMIGQVKVEPEAVSIELDRAVKVRHLQHDGRQSTRFPHGHIVSDRCVVGTAPGVPLSAALQRRAEHPGVRHPA